MIALMIVGGAVVGGLAFLGLAVVVKVGLLMLAAPKNTQKALNDAQARIVQAQRLVAVKGGKK
jgi:hypothetical protein